MNFCCGVEDQTLCIENGGHRQQVQEEVILLPTLDVLSGEYVHNLCIHRRGVSAVIALTTSERAVRT